MSSWPHLVQDHSESFMPDFCAARTGDSPSIGDGGSQQSPFAQSPPHNTAVTAADAAHQTLQAFGVPGEAQPSETYSLATVEAQRVVGLRLHSQHLVLHRQPHYEHAFALRLWRCVSQQPWGRTFRSGCCNCRQSETSGLRPSPLQ